MPAAACDAGGAEAAVSGIRGARPQAVHFLSGDRDFAQINAEL